MKLVYTDVTGGKVRSTHGHTVVHKNDPMSKRQRYHVKRLYGFSDPLLDMLTKEAANQLIKHKLS